MAATVALREALNQGISSGNLVDTKIILYSHRDSSGQVCRPKALYTNSHVLKTVPYFNDRESIVRPNTTLIVPPSKSFSGAMPSPNQKTSTRKGLTKNLRKITDICLIVTLRMMKTRGSPRSSVQASRRFIRLTRLVFPAKTEGSYVRSTRSASKKGRSSKSRTWRS